MKIEVVHTTAVLCALAIFLIGVVGMLVCGLFLLSSSMRDIVGAGFGFVGGTVLVGCGVISLALQSRGQYPQR